jgi:hypothetical protein
MTVNRKYVAGGLVGAFMATGLVVLGMNLAPAETRDVTLTSEAAEAPDITPADEVPSDPADPGDELATTSTTDLPSLPTTTIPAVTLEKRVGEVEGRVDRLETKIPTHDCPAGLVRQLSGRGIECVESAPAGTGGTGTSSTVTSSTTLLAPQVSENITSTTMDPIAKPRPTTSTTTTSPPPSRDPVATFTHGGGEEGDGWLTVEGDGPLTVEVRYLESWREHKGTASNIFYYGQIRGSRALFLNGVESIGQAVAAPAQPESGWIIVTPPATG